MLALIFCGDLKYCPYIRRYIEILELNNKSYKVYFWNRSGEQLDLGSNYKYYNESSRLDKTKAEKLFDFAKFKKWLICQLKKDNPAKLVLLSTLTGVVLSDYLKNRKGQFVFDIRDYSYEHIILYKKLEYKIIHDSYFTVLSSKGFRNFLPQKEYIIAHNFNRNDIKDKYELKKTDERISFVWNGLIRYFDYQKMYLDVLKNDDRFIVIYHGDGPEIEHYKKYAKSVDMKNIMFTGSYDNNLKADLLKNANILNNCYGYRINAGNKLKYAVSNRFYDGIIYHIPQIVEPEGFKHQWTIKCGVGASVKPDKDFADKLYNYYINIDKDIFDENCNKTLQQVIEDDDLFIQKITDFIM